jgi:hypothetical protein
VKAQLKISEQRSLADSAVIDHLRANVRRLRVAGSWYRQCAFAKILSGSRPCQTGTQTDPVHFAKHRDKEHRKSSAVDPQTGAVLSGGASQQVAGSGSKPAGDNSDSDDSKQENRYTYAGVMFHVFCLSILQHFLRFHVIFCVFDQHECSKCNSYVQLYSSTLDIHHSFSSTKRFVHEVK